MLCTIIAMSVSVEIHNQFIPLPFTVYELNVLIVVRAPAGLAYSRTSKGKIQLCSFGNLSTFTFYTFVINIIFVMQVLNKM